MKKFLASLITLILINAINIISYADEMVPGVRTTALAIIHSNNNIVIYCVIGAIIVAALATILLVLINKKKAKEKGEF